MMTYFANGDEGRAFEARYCDRCINNRDDNCPIWTLHLNWNYEQSGEDETSQVKRSTLDHFISGDGIDAPRTCNMFVVAP